MNSMSDSTSGTVSWVTLGPCPPLPSCLNGRVPPHRRHLSFSTHPRIQMFPGETDEMETGPGGSERDCRPSSKTPMFGFSFEVFVYYLLESFT